MRKRNQPPGAEQQQQQQPGAAAGALLDGKQSSGADGQWDKTMGRRLKRTGLLWRLRRIFLWVLGIYIAIPVIIKALPLHPGQTSVFKFCKGAVFY
ncbi:hypothetical protein SRHO_G00130410 [Serrasalmus rhombeus]